MYCPKCGNEMIASEKTLKCESGEMELAQWLLDGLRETFITGSNNTPPRRFTFTVGGTWHCPADGTKMEENEGVVGCPKCGKSLNPFLFNLIERHVHV